MTSKSSDASTRTDTPASKQLLRNCPVCDGQAGFVLHHQKFTVPDGYPVPSEYDLVSCCRCGMIFADTAGTKSDYDRYYCDYSIYESPAGTDHGATPPRDLPRLACFARLCADQLPDFNAAILDIGCANGGLLQAMARLGYQNLTGIDTSANCVAHTRRLGFQAIQGTLETVPAQPQYDAVFLTAVLEHVLDVRTAAHNLARCCKPGGIVAVELPDAAHYVDYLNSPFQDINIEHINHFSLKSLDQLMAPLGLSRVFAEHKGFGQPGVEQTPSLIAGYRKQNAQSAAANWSPDPDFRYAMQRYLDESAKIMTHLDEQIRGFMAEHRQFIVWGVGQLAMKLLNATALKQARILAYVDGNAVKVGKKIAGVPIVSKGDARQLDPHTPILVTTVRQGPEIAKQIAALGLKNSVLLFQPFPNSTEHS